LGGNRKLPAYFTINVNAKLFIYPPETEIPMRLVNQRRSSDKISA